jgi:WD40 repeat-containing protein SMU1
MIELRELDTARALLRQSSVLAALKVDDAERYLKLEHTLSRPYFEPRDAWPDAGGKDARRRAIAGAIASELAVVPPSRLLALVGQALKWQQHVGALPPGTAFDLFRAAPPARRDELETYPSGAQRARLCCARARTRMRVRSHHLQQGLCACMHVRRVCFRCAAH